MIKRNETKYCADVAMLVEGCYPYISGGVSSWVQQMLTGLPELTFHLIILLPNNTDIKEIRYPIPNNVVKISHVFLQRNKPSPVFLPKYLPGRELITEFLNTFNEQDFFRIAELLRSAKNKDKILVQALYSKDTWNILKEIYEQSSIQNSSFLAFIWIMRSLFLASVNTCLADLPPSRVIHAVSTGYAGLLGALMKKRYPQSKFFITEHGIYTRERRMEISIAEWPERNPDAWLPEDGQGFYQKTWIKAFEFFSRVAYGQADKIVALFEKNNEFQISEGAPKNRVMAIPNAVDLSRFTAMERTSVQHPAIIGFLGRIVKIKDVKCLLRAASIVLRKHPATIFEIAGPSDEDPEYYESCLELTQYLGISDNVSFIGKVNAKEFLAHIDVLVLTSLSEGQPLVILEGYGCSLPCIAPDVGGCREIIEGSSWDEIGPSGIVTSQASPEETANAILQFIQNPGFYQKCSKNARKRVEIYYDQPLLFKNYRDLYNLKKRALQKSKNVRYF
jgi:glycosyltransferase involved in cell wall biosynthesis